MTLNGAQEDPADWNDVAVQITLLADGTGWVNMEDHGQPESAAIGLRWSANGGTLTVQLAGEETATMGFTVSGVTLTISDTEGQESWTWVYTRNEAIAQLPDPPIVLPPLPREE